MLICGCELSLLASQALQAISEQVMLLQYIYSVLTELGLKEPRWVCAVMCIAGWAAVSATQSSKRFVLVH